MCTYCVLQETDLSLLAHWDRDCIRTREVSSSYQHIAPLHVYVCVFDLYTHCITRLQCCLSDTTFCTFVVKVCVSVHIVACCAMQVLPCDAFLCLCGCLHISNCFVPYGQTPAQMNTDPLRWLWPSWNNTQKIHTHNDKHIGKCRPTYTQTQTHFHQLTQLHRDVQRDGNKSTQRTS